jgi:hypothetical protein
MHAIPPGRTITVSGRWMVEDSANPGNLISVNPPAPIPFAGWFVSPPITAGAAPVIVAQVEAPEPPETPEKYGDAQWVKIYKTQLTTEVTGDQLNSTNPVVVPLDPTQIETAWDILQASPPSGTNSNKNRTNRQNSGGIAINTRSVVRRYELYKYTGSYDATTHQVVCADGTCTAPSTGELGPALSAQNTATNVVADSLTVVRTGNGSVTDSNIKLSCGSACAVFATGGSAQTLTESTPAGRCSRAGRGFAAEWHHRAASP